MKTWTATLALAALAACEHRPPGAAAPAPLTDNEGVLLLDGLSKYGPQIQAAMGTRAERAERAPYSPPGWPLRRGEKVETSARKWELMAAFPEACDIRAPFWVGDRVFGASWSGTRYNGHFREYVPPLWYSEERWRSDSNCQLPPHLEEEVPAALALVPFDEVPRHPGTGMEDPHWTRERWLAGYVGEDDRRAQREAFGLPLPPPWMCDRHPTWDPLRDGPCVDASGAILGKRGG